MTKAGRDYLDPRQANGSVTQELVDDVIAAGGTLVVPSKSWRDPDSVDYRRRARLAEHLGKVPTEKLFAIRNLPDGNLEIELVSGPTMPGGGKPKPIEVPQRISRYRSCAP